MSLSRLDTREPQDPAARRVHAVFMDAFTKRQPDAAVLAAISDIPLRHRAKPEEIAYILMGFRRRRNIPDDPRLMSYAKILLENNVFAASDLLMSLLARSNFASDKSAPKPGVHSGLGSTCEERIFHIVTRVNMAREEALPPRFLHSAIYAICLWLHTYSDYESGRQLEQGALYTMDTFAIRTYDALAAATLAILERPHVQVVSKQSWWKNRRAIVVTELESFDLNILQVVRSQFAGRLQALTRIPPFRETDDKGRPILTDDDIQALVADSPIIHVRAGMYVWLNACLCGRPFTDDESVLSYLHNRYPDDKQNAVIGLLMAAFDVMTNCLLRKESRQSIQVIRSFISNKLPVLLMILSSFLQPSATIDSCIQMAFLSITMDALPPISAGATDVRDMLKRVRSEFLQACVLHGLILENTVTTITEEPVNLPKETKLNKDVLVTQLISNVSRLESLMDDVSKMQGNAGAISNAVVELVGNLCINKDTMSLKSACNTLIRKITDMDIIMQYTQPLRLLLPLVTVLNEWVHDQDQAEFTPSYEEFASILLFTLAMIHRYDLSKADIGISDNQSLVFTLLQSLSTSFPVLDLSSDQNDRLTKWVDGLFSTDDSGESSGISDEVMRHCPPQEFYLLVPTLFEQSVLACRASILTIKTLKGGLELLLEPFLLPSLLSGLSWIVKHSWEDHGDADILLQILEKLLKPSSSSQDTQAMHRAIVAMVAEPLIHSLQVLTRKQPSKKIATALIELLKPHLKRQRTNNASKAEIEEWSSTPEGGFAQCVRNSVSELVAWTLSVGPTPLTKYTHIMFYAACNALGSDRILDALILELTDQAAAGNEATAMDIVVNLICAPLPGHAAQATLTGQPAVNTTLSVRDVLRFRNLDTKHILDSALLEAEIVVRLGRRVETQSALPVAPQIPIVLPVDDHAADQMMQDLGLTEDVVGMSEDVANAVMQLDDNAVSAAAAAAVAGVDFNDVGLVAGLDLTGAATADMGGMGGMTNLVDLTTSDTNMLDADSSQTFFGDINMDMNSNQALANDDGMLTNQEDDIFADLTGVGDFGEEFSFV